MNDDRRLRVAIIDEELPYPATSGKRIRTLNLIRRLAERHELTYLCHRNTDPLEAAEAIKHFAKLGIRTIVADRAPLGQRCKGAWASMPGWRQTCCRRCRIWSRLIAARNCEKSLPIMPRRNWWTCGIANGLPMYS